MKQLTFGHSLMGLYLSEIIVSTTFKRAYIFLNKYIPFRVPVVINFVRVTNFEDGIQKNHCWTLSGQRLVFSQIWFSETMHMPVRFFNCCDFISSVNAYWVWLRHFLILFLPFNSFQFGASFAQDSAILQIFISSFGSKQPTNRASLIIPLV